MQGQVYNKQRRRASPDATRVVRRLLIADLAAYDATDRSTADRSDGAATRKDGTTDGADTGADRGVLVLRRHPATTAQAKQHCHGHRTDCKSLYRFHWNTSLSNIG
jgi:hypothetical protein